jgi:type III pantothenate kinase
MLNKTFFSVSKIEVEIEKILKNFPRIKKCLVSSVGKLQESQLNWLEKHCEVIQLSSEVNLPFKNLYKSPKTLGVDRLALMSAVVGKGISGHVLVIDAGTCITYDFINKDHEYLGGAISAGLKMRYKALHEFTSALPYIEKLEPTKVTGTDTLSCMNSGCINGVLFEMDGAIQSYQTKYQDLTVILTGGDANFFV